MGGATCRLAPSTECMCTCTAWRGDIVLRGQAAERYFRRLCSTQPNLHRHTTRPFQAPDVFQREMQHLGLAWETKRLGVFLEAVILTALRCSRRFMQQVLTHRTCMLVCIMLWGRRSFCVGHTQLPSRRESAEKTECGFTRACCGDDELPRNHVTPRHVASATTLLPNTTTTTTTTPPTHHHLSLIHI